MAGSHSCSEFDNVKWVDIALNLRFPRGKIGGNNPVKNPFRKSDQPDKRWAMVIDLTRCTGCAGCQLACKAENFTPPGITWSRVEFLEVVSYPQSRRHAIPVGCMQCEGPECVRVCPTGASSQRKDGIVTVDADKCIGCKSCMIACPYGARYILEEERTYFPGYITPYEEQGYSNFQVGTVSKCDFCAHRIDEGLSNGLVPGVDREATPACVINCWANARTFGDLNDPNSEVHKLVSSGQVVQLKPETGLDPRVFYLAPGRTAVALSGGLPNRSNAYTAVVAGTSQSNEDLADGGGSSVAREGANLP